MCGYFCIGFIYFLLKGKSFPDYANFFSPNDHKNNDKIILTKKMKKLYCFICRKYKKFEKPKISYLLEKTFVLSVICTKWKNEYEKIFKEKNSIEILKILGVIVNI